MGKIYVLMGKSSSGKDTIFKMLLERLSLCRIISYTTRPIRENEKEGVEYHFCSVNKFEEYLKKGLVIEKRVYDTYFGKWYYFTVDDGQIDIENNDYLVIGTLKSYQMYQEFFQKENICPIYIEVDDIVRLKRAVLREEKQSKPMPLELCRRFLADDIDFSDEKLKEAGIEKVFYNNN